MSADSDMQTCLSAFGRAAFVQHLHIPDFQGTPLFVAIDDEPRSQSVTSLQPLTNTSLFVRCFALGGLSSWIFPPCVFGLRHRPPSQATHALSAIHPAILS